jgi:hypothetical protein
MRKRVLDDSKRSDRLYIGPNDVDVDGNACRDCKGNVKRRG